MRASLLISLSASGQIAPNQWLDPKNGVNYQVAAQTPQYKIDTFEAMRRTPITAPSGGMKQLLYNLAGLNMSAAAKKGAISAVEAEPCVGLRSGLLGGRRNGEGSTASCLRPDCPRF
jgi:hypothetical protein